MAEIKKINGNTLCDDVARDAAGAAKTAADEAMAKAAVQPDWNEGDPTSPAYIKNRIGGYKRSEEERRVVYDETTAEYIDVDVMGVGQAIRYRKASDTLLSPSDWYGAEIVIAAKDADGAEQETVHIQICDSFDESDAIPDGYEAAWIEPDQVGKDTCVYWVCVGEPYDSLTYGIIATEDVVYANSAGDISIPKGVWVLDFPFFMAEMTNGVGAATILANTLDARDDFTPVTMYHKSITLQEIEKIPCEMVENAEVRADWEEINRESPAYVKNKPFGRVLYICPEQKVKGEEYPGYSGRQVKLVQDETSPEKVYADGVQSVYATFDGKTYWLSKRTNADLGIECWGNPTVGHYEGTGIVWDGEEPQFRINSGLGYVYLNDGEEHTISITAVVATRLDKDWINTDEIEKNLAKATEAANTQADWSTESTTDVSYVKNRPFYKTKYIVPQQGFAIEDWEEVGNGHYRAKPKSCVNRIIAGKGYDMSYRGFTTTYISVLNPGIAVVYDTQTEIAPFNDDYKITVRYMIYWATDAGKGDVVYADGYLYVREKSCRLKTVSIQSFGGGTMTVKIDPVYLPYTAGTGIAISDTGVVSADVSEIKTYTDEALSALAGDGSDGRKMLKGVLSNASTRKYGIIYPPLEKGEWGITRIQEPDDESVDGIRFSFGHGTDKPGTDFELLVADGVSTIRFPTEQHFALKGVVEKKGGYSVSDVLRYDFNEDDQTKKMTLLSNMEGATKVEGVVITTKHSIIKGSETTLITTAIKLRSSRISDDDGVVLDAIGGQLLANGRNMDFANPETNATEFYLKSSTADSTKRFKITVTDDGTLAATEVV